MILRAPLEEPIKGRGPSLTTGHSNSSLGKGTSWDCSVRTHRNQDASGLFRWYNDYELPEAYEHKTVTVRLYNNDEDAARKLNRTENVRPIPPSDPDFKEIYGRRSDSESINRGLEDTLYLGRAHSVGHARQQVNLLGYALMVNSLALYEHRRRRKLAAAA